MKAVHLLSCKENCAAGQERDSEKTARTALLPPCPENKKRRKKLRNCKKIRHIQPNNDTFCRTVRDNGKVLLESEFNCNCRIEMAYCLDYLKKTYFSKFDSDIISEFVNNYRN